MEEGSENYYSDTERRNLHVFFFRFFRAFSETFGVAVSAFHAVLSTREGQRNLRYFLFIGAFLMVAFSWIIFGISHLIYASAWYLWIPGSLSTIIYMFAFFIVSKQLIADSAAPVGWNDRPPDQLKIPIEMLYLWIAIVNMIPMIIAIIIAYVDHHNGEYMSSSYASAAQTMLIFGANVVIMMPGGICTIPKNTET